MQARTHLIRIQRSMYRRLRQYARAFLGSLSPSLKKYYLEYLRDFHDFKEVSTKRELLLAIQDAHIVLCGDYHTLSQAQRTVIRLLRDVLPPIKRKKRRLVLALEMLRSLDNSKIASFFAGKVSEKEFLGSISFRRNWGFSWENYRKIFHFARDKSIEVIGINVVRKSGRATLKQRDVFAAKVIADLSEKEENALIFVLVGDLHLAGPHLPKDLKHQLEKRGLKRRVLVIHQNNERFYWKLVERGLEQLVDVVKVSDDVFCVMNTPPWVKLQSHVKWAELASEGDTQPVLTAKQFPPRYDAYAGETFDSVDHDDEIRELVEIIRRFVGIDREIGDDFHTFGPLDLSFLGRLETEKHYPKARLKILAKCLTEFESHFIAGENIIFLTSLSLNHAATQAAIYLHAKVSGAKRVFEVPDRDFYPMVWVEALGFLGSKVINHKRKCNGPSDLDDLVVAGSAKRDKTAQRQNVEVARLALAHLAEERKYLRSRDKQWAKVAFSKRLKVDEVLRYHKVAKLLGQLLGHALYTCVMENRMSREELKILFHNPFDDSEVARRLYLEWIERVDLYGYRNVTKTERL